MAYRDAAAEERAGKVLMALDLQGQRPIDPIAIADASGVKVWSSKLETDVAGLLVRHLGERPEIYLNRDDSPHRQRFTCAHELGHYFLRADRGDSKELSYIDFRNDLSTRGVDSEERYANSFAAALLMPQELVSELFDRGHFIVGLAALFNVSEAAMRFRLKNLGLL